ncbi:polysaccharide biosynthesis/export family protein [Candidatus Raskinella chloraquaticus]|uniref:Uncharacterized protein n=1 Tax=Candidatus Raskinella chloraquaticus TaxID=1951219 RepID=A0A1W9I0K3_9HYPH|nr:MAG: hypothetical protein A4S15_05280 [Proteobacteria bacterium SG_bin8]
MMRGSSHRFQVLTVLLMAAVLVTGCVRTAKVPAAQAVFDALDQPYTLDTGDRLRIIVFGQAELSNLYTVDQTGRLSVPLIGNVAVRGLTTKETEDQIASALRNGFLKTPQVTVEVETYRPFFVLGEVTQPGQYPYVLGMTAQTAVAIARGFTPRARQATVEITRIVNGELVRAEVPIHHPLRPGDTIQIFERWF